MKRYILVKENGETFVARGDTLVEALDPSKQPKGCPPENGVIGVITDKWSLVRSGNWIELAKVLRL